MSWSWGTGEAVSVADIYAVEAALARAVISPAVIEPRILLSPSEWELFVAAERWRERTERRARYRGSRKARRAERLLRGNAAKRWREKTPSQRKRILSGWESQ